MKKKTFDELLDQKILVQVDPVDDWNEWVFIIQTVDAMAPFCTVHQSSIYAPFKTYQEAMVAGIEYANENFTV